MTKMFASGNWKHRLLSLDKLPCETAIDSEDLLYLYNLLGKINTGRQWCDTFWRFVNNNNGSSHRYCKHFYCWISDSPKTVKNYKIFRGKCHF